ncbi:MAG: hypothetical protein PHY25_04895 [Dehalococcoidales bacterium]|nr:hypothetical protein [Dehalococcoidales bacterium]
MDMFEDEELRTIWIEAENHIHQGEYREAIEIYKYILARYSDRPDYTEYANAFIAEQYLTLRQLDLARYHITQALSLNPAEPHYHYILGHIYTLEQQWDKAIIEFEYAVSAEPDDGEYCRALGWALCQKGDRHHGLKYLKRAITLQPANTGAFADLAAYYLSILDFPKAKKYVKKALRLDPGNLLIQNMLETIYAFSLASGSLDKITDNFCTEYANPDCHDIHRFKVTLKDNPDIWRIIDIKSTQRLSSLHKAILKAFDRSKDGNYSFFLNNVAYDEEYEYASPEAARKRNVKMAGRLRIDSVGLYSTREFLYLFDYDNEQWHTVEMIDVFEKVTKAEYPRVVKRKGKLKQ